MLLWTSCVRQRDSSWSPEERSQFAVEAWNETQSVEDALNMHQCNLDTAIIYMCREYICKYVRLNSLPVPSQRNLTLLRLLQHKDGSYVRVSSVSVSVVSTTCNLL